MNVDNKTAETRAADKRRQNSAAYSAVAAKYADILQAERPAPTHPRLSLVSRASMFSPFAALRGFDDEIADVDERRARNGN